jgi:hypothetical protein
MAEQQSSTRNEAENESSARPLTALQLSNSFDGSLVGKGGFEPPRLAAHAPKACASAHSATPPKRPAGPTIRR